MVQIRTCCHVIAIVVCLNLGIEGIFGFDLISRMLVNFPSVLTSLKISCLFAGAVLMLKDPS